MKKWMLFGSLLVSVFLCACGKSSDTAQEKLAGIVTTDATENSKPTETPVSTVTPFPTEAPVSTVTTLPMETPALTPTPLPQYQPFFGDFSGYVYYYEDERNKDWEQDVVYIAKMFLTNHPVFQIASHMNMPGLEKSNNAKDAVTAYNEEKKEEFLKEINELVLNIKDLTDIEILYEMSRIVGLLEDLHSSVYVPYGKDFPI